MKPPFLNLRILVLLSIFSLQAVATELHPQSISVSGDRFVDEQGRQVIFSGVNLVNKNPEVGYIGPEGPDTFRQLRESGFNLVRLGIIWDGLEPAPGQYNEEYLKKLDSQIQWAAENGLFVVLDMHQDLFSVKYSDGAPAWATLDEGKPHHTGEVWSDAYLISPAVQTSWDNFWQNRQIAAGADGVQDYYARAWQYVAQRYSDNPTVIGFDLMNEPFVGSGAQQYMPVLITAFAELQVRETGEMPDVEAIGKQWSSSAGRYEILRQLEDGKRFAQVVGAASELNRDFEMGPLQDFYQKVADAIREVTREKILFLNHSYFSNSGIATAIEPVKLADASTDPQVAYAAHGYDLLVDTENLANSSEGRLEYIFDSIREGGERMGVPVLVGEWGAFGRDMPGMTELARTHTAIFEQHQFSNTYWAYGSSTDEKAFFRDAVIRPYAPVISGELLASRYDRQGKSFTVSWREGPSRSSMIYLPEGYGMASVELSPKAAEPQLQAIDGTGAAYLVIPASGAQLERQLRISFN